MLDGWGGELTVGACETANRDRERRNRTTTRKALNALMTLPVTALRPSRTAVTKISRTGAATTAPGLLLRARSSRTVAAGAGTTFRLEVLDPRRTSSVATAVVRTAAVTFSSTAASQATAPPLKTIGEVLPTSPSCAFFSAFASLSRFALRAELTSAFWK